MKTALTALLLLLTTGTLRGAEKAPTPESSIPTLHIYTAPWCTPCQQMKPTWQHQDIKHLTQQYNVQTHNIDKENPHRVRTIPTLIIEKKNGTHLTHGYATPTQLKEFLQKGLAP